MSRRQLGAVKQRGPTIKDDEMGRCNGLCWGGKSEVVGAKIANTLDKGISWGH